MPFDFGHRSGYKHTERQRGGERKGDRGSIGREGERGRGIEAAYASCLKPFAFDLRCVHAERERERERVYSHVEGEGEERKGERNGRERVRESARERESSCLRT